MIEPKFISKILQGSDGTWGIYLKDLISGKVLFERNENEIFPAASVAKIPIAVFVMAKAASGGAGLNDRLEAIGNFKLGGSGILHHLDPDLRLTLLDVVKLMLILSDNTAAKIIVRTFTPEEINNYLGSVGLRITRLKIDGDKFGFGMTTPRELSDLMEGIYARKFFDDKFSEQLIAILKESASDLGIRRLLPHDRYNEKLKLEVANKGGSLPGVRNETGIVFSKRPYVLTVLSKGVSDQSYKPDNKGWLTIAKLSELIYKELA